MGRLTSLRQNFGYVWREGGIWAIGERLALHGKRAAGRLDPRSFADRKKERYVDVCFINGCGYGLPHPIRYRIDHQMEQLRSAGMSSMRVDAWELTERVACLARIFVIFRCPYTPEVESFINLAHKLNKQVLYDIDDLVFDTCYTDEIPYLATMSPNERAEYDNGVRLMGRTLSLCDGAITTTTQLAAELRKYVDPVYVNRNTASEEMLFLSERAAYERDELPELPLAKVPRRDRHRWRLARRRRENRAGFSIGYFSGSITHNDDMPGVIPALARFMADYPDVRLHVVGELDLPGELIPFQDRIVRLPFLPWRRLPQQLSFVDVNLIPLADTVFNAAKSENKWVEAALVKVPSIASDVGALGESIVDGKTGLLCSTSDEWYKALVRLKNDDELRASIGKNAYAACRQDHIACGTGVGLATFLSEQMHESIVFAMPGFGPVGGVAVATKHAAILQDAGRDVFFLDTLKKPSTRWIDVDDKRIPVIHSSAHIDAKVDKGVATLWATLNHFNDYPSIVSHYYLVQGYEIDFYEPGDPRRVDAGSTYGMRPGVTYCTISPWCRDWLAAKFGKEARYCPNGIELSDFQPVERDWSGKIRILIEGDSSNAQKNVDESFRIAELLDSGRYEIWFLTNQGDLKPFYRVDRCFKRVPHDRVSEIYQQCHILLKTSLKESFSYPPLEMMATGGQVVVLRNDGNAIYLENGKNSLLFDAGEDELAAHHIERLARDAELRDSLRENGLLTARSLSWDGLVDQVLALYS